MSNIIKREFKHGIFSYYSNDQYIGKSLSEYGEWSEAEISLLKELLADNENIIEGLQDGAVNLYYDGSKKFETTSSGIAVTGVIEPTGNNGATSLPAAVVDDAPLVDCKITLAANGTKFD